MRVREFIQLATLLLVGLLVNHCAFEKDVMSLDVADRIEKTADLQAKELEDRLDQASREIDEKMERLDDRLEEAGKRLEGTIENGGIEQSSQVTSAGGKLNVSITYRLPSDGWPAGSLMFMEIPRELALTLNALESDKLTLSLWGASEMKSPNFTADDNGIISVRLADGDMPEKAEAKLPGRITKITFGADEAIQLVLEPSEAELHLDSAVKEITIKRYGEWVTLTSPEWAIRIKGMKPDLKVVGADGEDLGELNAVGKTEITYIPSNNGEGGAQ